MFVVDNKEKSPYLITNSFAMNQGHFFLYDLLQIYLWLIIEIADTASQKK